MTWKLYEDRIKALQATMVNAGIDLAAIAPTANMRYLAGFAPKLDERFCALLVSQKEIQARAWGAASPSDDVVWTESDSSYEDGLGVTH